VSKEAERVYLTNKMIAGAGDLPFPIAYPNHEFNIPVNAAYGEFFIVGSPRPIIVGGQGTGKVRVRYVGFVQLTVWIPKDSGTKIGTLASDTFKDIFQFKLGRDAAQSSYKFGVLQDFNPDVKAGWECMVYRVPFQRDAIEAIQVSE
jgi:hypothetical protein